jgi:hypothetical protein
MNTAESRNILKLRLKLEDWMLNSYEHCQDPAEDAKELCEEFGVEAKVVTQVSLLMRDWLDNSNDVRMQTMRCRDFKELGSKIKTFIGGRMKTLE